MSAGEPRSLLGRHLGSEALADEFRRGAADDLAYARALVREADGAARPPSEGALGWARWVAGHQADVLETLRPIVRGLVEELLEDCLERLAEHGPGGTTAAGLGGGREAPSARGASPDGGGGVAGGLPG